MQQRRPDRQGLRTCGCTPGPMGGHRSWRRRDNDASDHQSARSEGGAGRMRHDRRLHHLRRRRIVAHDQPRLRRVELRVRPGAPGRHLRGQPRALAQQRSRAVVAHGLPRSESPHPRTDDRRPRRVRRPHGRSAVSAGQRPHRGAGRRRRAGRRGHDCGERPRRGQGIHRQQASGCSPPTTRSTGPSSASSPRIACSR